MNSYWPGSRSVTLGLCIASMVVAMPAFAQVEDLTTDQIRLGRPILEGLPLIYWRDGGLVVSVVPGAEPWEDDELMARLERLHGDPTFERAWRGFAHEVFQVAGAMRLSGEAADRFNLEVLPELLLAHPELVEALLSGEMAETADPPHANGPKVCIERHYGASVMECCATILSLCVWHCKIDCDTSKTATSCYEDTEIPCPDGSSTMSLRLD
jgi:hypothetical protein